MLLLAAGGQVTAQTDSSSEMADRMYEALGGRERWASLRSLYIKARHTQPSMDIPYQSEIWRGIDEFKLRIEQQNERFHNVGLFSDQGGWIHRLKNDSLQVLTPERLQASRASHQGNIYVLLQRIARGESYVPRVNGQRLEFHRDGQLVVAFILDEKDRPAIFISPGTDGQERISHFDRWHESDGFVHPAGGGPVDGGFHFVTEVWRPSDQDFTESFDVAYLPHEN